MNFNRVRLFLGILVVFCAGLMIQVVRYILFFAVVTLALSSVAGCITQQEDNAEVVERVAVGDVLPDFEVTMSDGKRISTANLAGRRSLIVFFNTDCSDCRRELPVLQSVYEAIGDRCNWLCIAREESAERIAEYWAANRFTMPYSPQPDRRVFHLFATENIPRVYIADSNLRIIAAFTDDKQPLSRDILLSYLQ